MVSIGIPTYNQQSYIAAAIESALRQDYPRIEIVIADDNSTDNTAEVVKPFLSDSRVKYYKNDANLGRVNNYRKLLYEYAAGDWYLNLDGDDVLMDDTFLSTAMSYIQTDPNIVLFQAMCLSGDISGNQEPKKNTQNPEITVVHGTDFLLNYPFKYRIWHLSALYDRNKAIATDFYRSNTLRSDSESLLRLALKGNVAFYKKPIGIWRDNGQNETWLLDENLLAKEKAVFDSVALAASGHITSDRLKKWNKKVKEHIDLYFIDSTLTRKPEWQRFFSLFRWAHLKWPFFKVFVKHFITLLASGAVFKK